MDHRRLAEYLVKIFPQNYKICTPDSINPGVKEFLENLYGLTPQKYAKLLESLDAESKVSEWKIIRIRYQKYDKIPVKILPIPIIATQGKAARRDPLPFNNNSKPMKSTEKEKKRAMSSAF